MAGCYAAKILNVKKGRIDSLLGSGEATEGYSIPAQETPNCKLLKARRVLCGSILRCLPASCTPLLASAIPHY